MSIALLGAPLSAARRKALVAGGHRLVPAARADLRVYVGARPPARPPHAPWVWCSPSPIGAADAASAVLAGAYDVVALDDQLAATLARRLGELGSRRDVAAPPVGYVARSPAARRMLADLDRAARTSMAVLLTGETGTGKDLAARHLHATSGRDGRAGPDQLRRDPERADRGRAVRLRARRVLRRRQRLRRPAPRGDAAAPCSSTRSTTRRRRCRSSCCACSRITSSAGSARTTGARSTSASSPRPTATSTSWCAAGSSAAISTSASRSCRSCCRRCAIARTTSRSSSLTCSRGSIARSPRHRTA